MSDDIEDFYVDPRQPDPRFPGRPTHEDMALLSDIVQGFDVRAGAGTDPAEIIGIDQESLMYFIINRLGVMGITVHTHREQYGQLMGIYIDALAVGKRFAEVRSKA